MCVCVCVCAILMPPPHPPQLSEVARYHEVFSKMSFEDRERMSKTIVAQGGQIASQASQIASQASQIASQASQIEQMVSGLLFVFFIGLLQQCTLAWMCRGWLCRLLVCRYPMPHSCWHPQPPQPLSC